MHKTKPTQGKKLYSLAESYRILYWAMRTVPQMARAERDGTLSVPLRERLMIAVTEVNGCAMCSYAHTRIALEAGLGADEIRRLLGGEKKDVPPDELAAVLFAQHYADTRGLPHADAWKQVCEQYGERKALAMLGAIRGIMVGNAYGIPSGSLLHRLGVRRFQADARSRLPYELLMLLTLVPFALAAAVQAMLAKALNRPIAPAKA